ncbi:S8 family serine peptidase [Arthrobacter sp. zg-Y820]|uniref:S8 family serine peptidase n=1 Tax=unclassified Arthrobacter TaxID=235627 RepID=UPI0025419DE3|nr:MULTISPECIES: S8 family serine peptidase [unclassified Arthrobacter]MCC9195534.1 S8 family serine peptidase [Arthrobacter sp. zg-Y820]MDK1278393.1 S8 family serine peptidase [Arthrobacter sp. zg.Y820]WIB10264.1 S8 family serine peptidase [Arthrobacter sp. zg-Y820]
MTDPSAVPGLPRRRIHAVLLAALLALTLLPAAPASADEWRDKQYWLADSGFDEAWKVSQGAGVKVAVIDTGIDPTHPDLAGAVTGGTDVSGAGDPAGSRGLGNNPSHGTLVATLLAGRGHAPDVAPDPSPTSRTKETAKPPAPAKSEGIIGVAPKAELLAVSAWIGPDNPAGIPIEDQIPDAIRWAVDNGAQVINMSLGSSSTSWPESWDSAFLYAEQQDVVVVVAAGNRSVGMVQVGAPATIPGVLTVAGVDRNGEASRYSSSEGISIGVAAPAENLVGGLPGEAIRYADWSGTSGAAPLVAGTAALIRSAYPDLSAADVINRIISTTREAGAPGQDTLYGYGILDAGAALTADVPSVAANPLGNIADWIRIHRRDASTAPASDAPVAVEPQEPDLPEPTVPVALPPDRGFDPLPAALVLGFGGLLLGVTAAGTAAVVRARRRTGDDTGQDAVAEDTETGQLKHSNLS